MVLLGEEVTLEYIVTHEDGTSAKLLLIINYIDETSVEGDASDVIDFSSSVQVPPITCSSEDESWKVTLPNFDEDVGEEVDVQLL